MPEKKKIECDVTATDTGLSKAEAEQLKKSLDSAIVLALPERMKGGQVDVSSKVKI